MCSLPSFPRTTLILGGSFDPVHWGHLHTAQAALQATAADRLLFVPAAASPHKSAGPFAGAHHRLKMLQLAAHGHDTWEIADLEILRPPPSFTWDTLRQLQAANPAERFILLLGADQLPKLHTWRNFPLLAATADFAVMPRPGWPLSPSRPDNIPPDAWRHFQRLSIPEFSIASSAIRGKIAVGESIDDLVPPAVAGYIRQYRLYLPAP